MDKDTGCPACDKQKGMELCPIHRLEMISEQISYWTNCAITTLKEIKQELEDERNKT